MSGIKTGNKGFVNPVDGKVYTVDPVLNGEDGINSNPQDLKTYDPGDMNVDKSVKDIGKSTRITLGTYLSKSTKGEVSPYTNVPNKYSIDPSTDSSSLLSLTDNGYPVSPSPTGNSEKFDGNLPSSFSENFAVLNQDSKKINKGLSSDSAPDGHTLLPTAAEKAPAGGAYIKNANLLNDPISTYTKEVVTDNSFNPYNFSFLPPEIDAISPPKEFQPSINVGETLGNYSDEGASKSKWNLEQLR